MRTVRFNINYGGYIGTDVICEVEVPDDADELEIEDLVHEEYMRQLEDNCYYEILEEEE